MPVCMSPDRPSGDMQGNGAAGRRPEEMISSKKDATFCTPFFLRRWIVADLRP